MNPIDEMTDRELLIELVTAVRELTASLSEVAEKASSNPMLKALTGGLFK